MGKLYDSIDSDIQQWIENQRMFFIGTAPLSGAGSINVSPKGLDTLRVVDEHTLAYMDFGGSGIETVAHLRENARIVVMMCAFEGPPKVFRFHGEGDVVTPLDPDFSSLAQQFDRSEVGARAIIRIRLSRISDSCGFGVPLYDFRAHRDFTPNYIKNNGVEKLKAYMKSRNSHSIDGLAGITDEEAEAFVEPDSGSDFPV